MKNPDNPFVEPSEDYLSFKTKVDIFPLLKFEISVDRLG